MSPLMIIVIIIACVSVITFFFIKVYNSLVLLKNKLGADWKQLIIEINFRFDLAVKYIGLVGNYVSPNIVNSINQLDGRNKMNLSVEDIMNNYIEFEKCFLQMLIELEDKKIGYQDWNKSIIDSKTRLDKARDIYNDDVLGLNNKVDLFPFSIVASVTGFSKGIYFRSEN